MDLRLKKSTAQILGLALFLLLWLVIAIAVTPTWKDATFVRRSRTVVVKALLADLRAKIDREERAYQVAHDAIEDRDRARMETFWLKRENRGVKDRLSDLEVLYRMLNNDLMRCNECLYGAGACRDSHRPPLWRPRGQ